VINSVFWKLYNIIFKLKTNKAKTHLPSLQELPPAYHIPAPHGGENYQRVSVRFY
jgi:hypothetical protein